MLAVLSVAGAARAQTAAPQDHTIDAQLFQPAIGHGNFLTIEGADVPEHKRLSFGLAFNYQRRPYIVSTQGTSAASASVVDTQLTTELDAAIGLFDRVQIGVGIPFTPYLAGDQTDPMGAPTGARVTESGIGDVRVEGKALLATLGDDDQYTLGLSGGLTLPTGKDAMRPYLGDRLFTGRLKGLATAQLGKLRAGLNLGLLARATSHDFATDMGPQLLYGAAGAYQVRERVEVMLEAYGRSGLSQFDKFYSDVNPFEIDLAVRWGVTSMWSLLVGGGRGLGNGIGAPQGRGFVAAAFNPDFRDRDGDGIYDVDDQCPDKPEDRDGFQDRDGCPDPDNDGDGILDAQDKCPNEAEDFDQFEDEDGCPELDNDKDGFPDASDACPNVPEDGRGKRPKDGCPSTAEDADGDGVNDTVDKCPDDPEDKDGFEDEDGCPDPDNDGDGIPDGFDACPNQPEDMDGFEDEDGCPDPDNDHDGISDAQDKCPLKPETLNGNKDDDGCPDPGAEIVRLGQGRIEVDERMGFGSEGGKAVLKSNARQAVGLVAMVLRGHADLQKVRIEVYAEGVTKEETQRRAEAVRDALVGLGVEAARLVPVGQGPGSPRVDFLIESTKPAPKAAPAAAPDAPASP